MSQVDVACEVELTQTRYGLPIGTIGTVEAISGHGLDGPHYRVRFYELPNGNRMLTPMTLWVNDGAVLRA